MLWTYFANFMAAHYLVSRYECHACAAVSRSLRLSVKSDTEHKYACMDASLTNQSRDFTLSENKIGNMIRLVSIWHQYRQGLRRCGICRGSPVANFDTVLGGVRHPGVQLGAINWWIYSPLHIHVGQGTASRRVFVSRSCMKTNSRVCIANRNASKQKFYMSGV